jgi:hypothetical protein
METPAETPAFFVRHCEEPQATKQSIQRQPQKMDCRVASLLAMTSC